MPDDTNRFTEEGRRLRLLRQAEGYDSQIAFSHFLGWGQSGLSQFETGKRRVPSNKVYEMPRKIPGFDPMWLWHGEKRGLGFDLRRRIEAEEAKEAPPSAGRERQDV